ncbi:alanine racemase [Candidatus Uhrbacteria bacterium RIFCSPHIGHO2_02_FULL_57_19]|uniref:Alanine racemase n=1 Tax=Candidatus Uhrbacteria bacterium RIFCSPHIGHO2_02_FULL_57_19 TaxID=1802391 RepID=A0A1F7U3H4_9BACT|nr:MAG: alanine racemase [Candidatus Uhrbacteria bacterium RIFCSPHIGHO2_02_FULL_57_19]
MTRRPKTWVEISKTSLLHNVGEFRRILGPATKLMAVIKSNAYGHGFRETAGILADRTDWFGVDNVDEGIAIRKNGIRKPILILGYTPLDRLRDAIRNDLRMTVYNQQTIKALSSIRGARPARVHIKIESGTTRQGVDGGELIKLAKLAKGSRGVEIEGISTHFANIEDTTDHGYASDQLRRFKRAADALRALGIDPRIKHTACSAAAILFPETHFNLARVGIGLYGLWPSKETRVSAQKTKLDLQPALTWKTIIAQIKRVGRGTPISYGLTERVTRDSTVAVLPIGYWDGYDRKLSSVGSVLIRGRRAKILGRVCMNMMMADITDIPAVRLEDEAVLIGRQEREVIAAEDLASKIGTVNYEVITRINPTMPRIVI